MKQNKATNATSNNSATTPPTTPPINAASLPPLARKSPDVVVMDTTPRSLVLLSAVVDNSGVAEGVDVDSAVDGGHVRGTHPLVHCLEAVEQS